MANLNNKENTVVAVVTGASSGIGKAIALSMQTKVDLLVAVDINQTGLASLSESLNCEHECLCIDISDMQQLDEKLGGLVKALGHVDFVINSAGVGDENDPEERQAWKRIIDINLNGAFYINSCILPYLSDGGRIVNIASVLGKVGNYKNTAYCAAKHGLVGYTKALALDLAMQKITVNAVLPGFVDTQMFRDGLARQGEAIGTDLKSMLKNSRKKVPLRKLVSANEVANIVGFLLSNEAASVTAQSWVIDGGALCGA